MTKRSIRHFPYHQGGVALIEFAMVLPFLFLLLFGGIEVTRLLLIQQKLEKAGYVLADLTTQYDVASSPMEIVGELHRSNMDGEILPQFKRIMEPYDEDKRRIAIVTALFNEVDPVNGGFRFVVDWQIAGGGTLYSPTSIVNGRSAGAIYADNTSGIKGTLPNFTAQYQTHFDAMQPSQFVLVMEVFYEYEPLLKPLLQGVGNATGLNFFLDKKIYAKRTFFGARKKPLRVLPPQFWY